jgi:hypothetical protein
MGSSGSIGRVKTGASPLEIRVVKIDGTELTLDATNARTVKQIKQAIGAEEGFVTGQQILQIEGDVAPLQDSQPVPWTHDAESIKKSFLLQLRSELEPVRLNATSWCKNGPVHSSTGYFCVVNSVSFHQVPGSELFQSAIRIHFNVRSTKKNSRGGEHPIPNGIFQGTIKSADVEMGNPLSSKLTVLTKKKPLILSSTRAAATRFKKHTLKCTDHEFLSPPRDLDCEVEGWLQYTLPCQPIGHDPALVSVSYCFGEGGYSSVDLLSVQNNKITAGTPDSGAWGKSELAEQRKYKRRAFEEGRLEC